MKIQSIPFVVSASLITVVIFAGGVFMGSSGVLAQQFNRIGLTSAAAAVMPSTQPDGIDFGPVWKAWRILDTRFVDAYATSTATTSTAHEIATATSTKKYQDRVWGLISGLTNAMGDPYTVFLPPSDAKVFNADISGSFEGVGMEITVRDQILTVVSPLKDTPAYRAGVKSGDKIIFIDGTSTKNMGTRTAVQLIRGKKGTAVTFKIIRDGAEKVLTIKVVRDTIQIPTIKTERRKDGIYVITLLNFSAKSADLFRNAITSFQKSGDRKLIIDLRGNPGGYLSAAVDIASWFLPAGKMIVTEDYAGHGENRVHRSRGYDILDNPKQLVVLVDRGSASAAEILSGALQAHKVATIIGTRSFGKGSVQEVIPLTPKTSLKVTVARWLLAKNKFIAHNGIQPDIVVKLPKNETYAQMKKKDLIMNAAVEFLQSK